MRGALAYFASMMAVGPLLLAGTFEGRAAPDDAKTCAKDSGTIAIEACSSAIKSNHYRGHELARLYMYRGVERRLKDDSDGALADYDEAIRADKKYADAYYNRCALYNAKENYDRAIADCSEAIKLGPNPKGKPAKPDSPERLANDRIYSDYYAERGLAFLKKDDYLHAIADLDNAIRQNPSNGRALKNRGLAYQARGDTSRADADFAAAKQNGEQIP
jgi:tetratricopeptide (TPR) repeat protein